MTNIDRRSGQVSYELPSHPDYPLGVANIVRSHEGMDGLGDARLHEIEVSDPVNDLSSDRQKEIIIAEANFDLLAKQRTELGLYHRSPKMAYDIDGNEIVDPGKRGWGDTEGVAKDFEYFLNSQAYLAWQSHLPSAEALRMLSGPLASRSIVHRKTSKEHDIDDNLRDWFKGCTDARAIRSRAAVVSYILSELKNKSGQSIYRPNWLSVACGTALPVYQSALQQNGTFKPNFTMVDINADSLDQATKLFSEFGIDGSIKTIVDNIFDQSALSSYSADLTDAVGIFEYIGEPLQRMLNKPDDFVVEFLKSLLATTDKYLIFGQMLEDRPVKYFTEAVIGWPWIQRRNPEEVIKIAEEAGIPSRAIDVYLTPEGVYGVYLIDKSKV